MTKRAYNAIETSPDVAAPTERLLRYGERLVTGTLPTTEAASDAANRQPLPEPSFLRYPYSQHHDLNLVLNGLLVGKLNVSLVEGTGVKQLFLNLNYALPRTYLIASRTMPRLTPIRITGRSYFIDERGAGAVAYVHDVFEDTGTNKVPVWAANALEHYRQKPWPVVRCYHTVDAVGAFQRALSQHALTGIQQVYDEVAAEYGYVSTEQFDWHQYTPLASEE